MIEHADASLTLDNPDSESKHCSRNGEVDRPRTALLLRLRLLVCAAAQQMAEGTLRTWCRSDYGLCRKKAVSQREYNCEETRDPLLCRGAGRGVRRFPGLG